MGERTDAKRSIESSARHMSEIAEELSRRASPHYIGEQAREKALNKTQEWKEEIVRSPMALGLIGGALGAAIGGALARNRRGSSFRESRTAGEYGYGGPSRSRFDLGYGEIRSREGSDGAGAMREKIAGGAQELKERAGDLVEGVRERIPTAAELGQKAEDNPMLIALGGIALGAIAALLLPVTRKERELLEPVKEKAGEAIGTLGNKVGESVQQAQQRIAGEQEGEQRQSETQDDLLRLDSPVLTH